MISRPCVYTHWLIKLTATSQASKSEGIKQQSMQAIKGMLCIMDAAPVKGDKEAMGEK